MYFCGVFWAGGGGGKGGLKLNLSAWLIIKKEHNTNNNIARFTKYSNKGKEDFCTAHA